MYELIRLIAAYYDLEPEDILKIRYKRYICFIRSTLCDVCHREIKINYTDLGNIFGVDRTTIKSGCEKSTMERKLWEERKMYEDRHLMYNFIKELIEKKGEIETPL
jgi:hypothetical protein